MVTIEEMEAFRQRLIQAGQLTDFLESVGQLDPLVNCTTEKVMEVGPPGRSPTANIFLRKTTLPRFGSTTGGHKHNFDHITLVIGSPVIRKTWKTDAEGRPIKDTVKESVWGRRDLRDGEIEALIARAAEDPKVIKELVDRIWKEATSYALLTTAKDICHQYTSIDGPAVILCIYAMRNNLTGDFQEGFGGSLQPYV